MASNKGIENIMRHNESLTLEQKRASMEKARVGAVVAQKKRKAMRHALKEALALKPGDPRQCQLLEAFGLAPTMENSILFAVLLKAQTGDIEAARFIRDTIGEKPTEQYALGILDKPVKAIDLTGLSDAELEAIADQVDDEPAAIVESTGESE